MSGSPGWRCGRTSLVSPGDTSRIWPKILRLRRIFAVFVSDGQNCLLFAARTSKCLNFTRISGSTVQLNEQILANGLQQQLRTLRPTLETNNSQMTKVDTKTDTNILV